MTLSPDRRRTLELLDEGRAAPPFPFGSLANSSIGQLGNHGCGATMIFDHHPLAEIALAAIVRTWQKRTKLMKRLTPRYRRWLFHRQRSTKSHRRRIFRM
jgi:hypothetical protein